MDLDYVETLQYGLPSTGGMGMVIYKSIKKNICFYFSYGFM